MIDPTRRRAIQAATTALTLGIAIATLPACSGDDDGSAPRRHAAHDAHRHRHRGLPRHLRQRRRLREAHRHAGRRGRSEGPPQRHHPGPGAGAGERPRAGRVQGRLRAHQAEGHEQGQRRAALRRAQPRQHPDAGQSGCDAGRRRVPGARLLAALFGLAGRRAEVEPGTADARRSGGEERRRLVDHRSVPRRADHLVGGAGGVAAQRRLQRQHDSVCAGEPRQHAARLHADQAHQGDRSAHPGAGGRLEVRRLQRHRQSVPRHRRRQQGLPEGRLRPELPVRTGLRRQGPEGDGRRTGRAARHHRLLPQVDRRRGRHRQSAGRKDHATPSARARRSRAMR